MYYVHNTGQATNLNSGFTARGREMVIDTKERETEVPFGNQTGKVQVYQNLNSDPSPGNRRFYRPGLKNSDFY